VLGFLEVRDPFAARISRSDRVFLLKAFFKSAIGPSADARVSDWWKEPDPWCLIINDFEFLLLLD
jgi:hypothetical protein